MRSSRRLLAVAVSALLLGTATTASAEPSLSDRETARSLMDDGDAKRDKGDMKAALKSYEAADAIMHVPTTGLEVARAQAQLGLLLEARETLSRVMRSPAKAGEPAPFTAARKTAETLSNDIAARIPSVVVVVTNADATQTPVVVFDGEVIPPAAAQAPRKVNPGHHTATARSGTLEKKQEIDVAERESKTVTIDLKPIPVEAPPAETPAPESPSSLPKVLIFGGFGLAAVGLGVGAVTGVLSISKVSDVKKDCVNDICPANRQDDIDSAKSLGTISTIGFIAGGVGIATGVVGIVLQGKQPSNEAPPVGASVNASLRLRPEVGPTWAGVSGVF